MSKNRQRVYAYTKTDRLLMESMEDTAVWSASTDVSGIATSTNHREGSTSMSFDKDGTTEAFGEISRTLDADSQLNIVDYLRGKLRFWINLSALTDVASVTLTIGESASANYEYTAADTDLTTGWNEVTFSVDTPSATNGAGAAWSSIGYIAVKVTLDAAGDTLTTILVDSISVLTELESNIETVNLDGTGLATAANQTTQLTNQTNVQETDDAAVSATKIIAVGGEVDDPDALAAATEGDAMKFVLDLARRLITTLGTLIAGEDIANDVLKVEERFTYQAIVAADTLVKTGAGFLHTVTISCDDAAPTAGSIIIYDNSAESGTEIFNHTFTTTPFVPFTVTLDVAVGTGIYIGFTTTADVNATLSYR